MHETHTHFLKDTHHIADTRSTNSSAHRFPSLSPQSCVRNGPNENSNCNKGLSANHQTEAKTQAAVSHLIKSHCSWNPVLMLQRPSCSLTHPAVEVLLSVGAATPHPGKASLHSTTWRGWSSWYAARPHPVQILTTNRDHGELLICITSYTSSLKAVYYHVLWICERYSYCTPHDYFDWPHSDFLNLLGLFSQHFSYTV